MADQFLISPETAGIVVVSTVFMYLAFVVLVRLLGPRSLTSMSSFDFACVVALGAVLGRTVLLAEPTLAIGVIALVTFFAIQGLLGLLRQNRRLDRMINRRPMLLAVNGELLRENMRRVHVVEDEIRQVLRRAGARGLHDVQCVVLERNGSVSVVGARGAVDPWLLEDVTGVSVRHEPQR